MYIHHNFFHTLIRLVIKIINGLMMKTSNWIGFEAVVYTGGWNNLLPPLWKCWTPCHSALVFHDGRELFQQKSLSQEETNVTVWEVQNCRKQTSSSLNKLRAEDVNGYVQWIMCYCGWVKVKLASMSFKKRVGELLKGIWRHRTLCALYHVLHTRSMEIFDRFRLGNHTVERPANHILPFVLT